MEPFASAQPLPKLPDLPGARCQSRLPAYIESRRLFFQQKAAERNRTSGFAPQAPWGETAHHCNPAQQIVHGQFVMRSPMNVVNQFTPDSA
jgi:hypothetical protein